MDTLNIWVALVAAKSAFVVLFGMNLGVLLTWTDRRQGAMMQDRVGPNRAVIWLPTRLAQVVLLGGALAAAGLAASALRALPPAPGSVPAFGPAFVLGGLGVFLAWFTIVLIASRIGARGERVGVDGSIGSFVGALGGARGVALLGLSLQVSLALALLATRGTGLGDSLTRLSFHLGALLFVASSLGGAAYAAVSLNGEPKVGLRLAGLLHPAADGLKTLFKEDFIPPNADRLMHSIAPFITFFPALVVLGVVPFGDSLCFAADPSQPFTPSALGGLLPSVASAGCPEGTTEFKLQVLDLNVGLLYFFALAGTGIVGAALAGWASDNKFSLLGGLRAASQMISYEVALGLTLIGVLMVYGTLRIDEMVRWQAENAWGIVVQPVAFFLFFAASVAESKRIPFDLPEGESELVAGYFTEYAGMKFAMFFFSEYVAVVSAAAIMAALFFGGWHLPFIERDGLRIALGDTVYFEHALGHGWVVLIGFLGFIAKVVALCLIQLAIRWTLPRFRYDQLMRLGWRKLLPLSLLNILATGLVILFIAGASPALQSAVAYLGDLSMAALALGGLGLGAWFLVFVFSPARKPKLLASSSAKFAEAVGGTSTAKMGA